MKELRTQHQERPLRTLLAFDPRRCAILLIGGDKTGENRFYERMIPWADKLYDAHLESLRRSLLKYSTGCVIAGMRSQITTQVVIWRAVWSFAPGLARLENARMAFFNRLAERD